MQEKRVRGIKAEESTSLCDTKYKIVLLGDMGVGKTSIIDRFVRDEFDISNNPTVGIDFLSRNLTIANRTYRLQLWDTAGQQKYKSLVPAYLRDANAAIFVYDVNRKDSLDNLKGWIQLYRENQSQESLAILVASKIDLLSETRNPLREAAQKLSQQEGMLYMEVSAKTGEKVAHLFNEVVSSLSRAQAAPSAEQQQAENVVLKLDSVSSPQGNRLCCYI